MAPAAVTTMPGRAVAVGAVEGVGVAVAVCVAVGVGLATAAVEGDGVGVGVRHEIRRAQTTARTALCLVTVSTRLLEHASMRIEPAIRVFLKDALAAHAVESIVLPLVAESDRMFAERLLADHAARLGHHSSSMSGWRARTSWPFSMMIRRTFPDAVPRISLKSFIASMRPMRSPCVTWLPTWTKAGACGEGER